MTEKGQRIEKIVKLHRCFIGVAQVAETVDLVYLCTKMVNRFAQAVDLFF
jgi:hypothetical protein